MSKRALDLAKRYGRKTDIVEIYKEIMEEKRRNGELVEDATENTYRITAFPQKNNLGNHIYKNCSIITADVQLQVMQWGMIPSWVVVKTETQAGINKALIDADIWRQRTFNARCEDIFEKRTFAEPIIQRRCIIPSTGYFEFHHNQDGTTTPFFLSYEDRDIISMGGIWNVWIHPISGERISTYSIITTPANTLASEIHNSGSNPGRMPLIIYDSDVKGWLNPNLSKPDIFRLMKPAKDEGMKVIQVSKDFRDLNPKDETILISA
ncbi:SOS response-associated peptidase [Parabacteroides sp. OttesenSCG-928-G06]|uniref:SOS response-associated peptidase n=1 Tax=Parabacteroides sp. PFB2-10 TaxID=1742405 RepID=UPI0024760373|nr:SOS response-associated peptidase [Parabacteroides sp. PFB2-10]MDL2281568.1 SOS response-associated peptidase [Parabacteroides sp. OttesenSCG-928-G06]MDL2281589.1 SOS response-associated peptidase [Parabacteroides sp. OttesenSCG-928-G06]